MKKMFIFPSNYVHIFISISYIFLLHIPIVRTAEDLLLQECSDTGNYTFGSPFDINLTFLLSSVSNNASKTGYESSSRGVSPDIVYALAQCRDDLSTLDCITCLNDASSNITGICPSGMEATVRFGNCLLRYSSSRFFSKTSTMMKRAYQTETVPSTDGAYFPQSLEVLMTSLSKTAASNETRFSYGDTEYDPSGTIYGMVQCVRDLSPSDCEKCLQDMISWFPNCCNRTTAATVFGPTCYLRYQILPFMGESSQPPLHVPRFLPQTTTSNKTNTGTGTGRGKSTSMAVIIVPILVSMIILAICAFSVPKLMRNKRPKLMSDPEKREASSLSNLGHTITETESPTRTLLPSGSTSSDVTCHTNSYNGASSPKGMSRIYSLADIKMATKDFSEKNKIGFGGYGEVFKGELDGQPVAVKRMNIMSENSLKQFISEVEILLQLRHGNLVELVGYCDDQNQQLLIYELVPKTSLDKYIYASIKDPSFNWEVRYKIIEGIVRGLIYMHEESKLNIIHRDLKAGNILIGEDMRAKIADFGTARPFDKDKKCAKVSSVVGTSVYMAPEYKMEETFTFKSDVFSFGILLLEIIRGREANKYEQSETIKDFPSYAYNLWEKEDFKTLIDTEIQNSVSEQKIKRCIHIGLLCIQHDPETRPNMSDVRKKLEGDEVLIPPQLPTALLRRIPEESDLEIKESG